MSLKSTVIVKSAEADLRANSSFWLDIGMAISILIMSSTFFFASSVIEDREVKVSEDSKVEIMEIPPTKQLQRPPPPARPQIPIEAEDEDEVDDVTIDDTEVNLGEDLPEIEQATEEEFVEFFAVQQKPEIIKKVVPVYPDIARKAGIEGRVVVSIIVDENGNPTNLKVVKGHPMLDDAAIDAVKQYKFKPGMQRDKPVKVKYSIPIQFKLNN